MGVSSGPIKNYLHRWKGTYLPRVLGYYLILKAKKPHQSPAVTQTTHSVSSVVSTLQPRPTLPPEPGRIHAIKMSVLPRLLYLFQGLRIEIGCNIFANLQSMLMQFIWHGGRARLSYRVLRLPKAKGGLALPDFKLYYKATQLRVIPVWSTRKSDKHWLHMEWALMGKHIWDVMWKPKADRPPNVLLSTPTRTTLKVWGHSVRALGTDYFSIATNPNTL